MRLSWDLGFVQLGNGSRPQGSCPSHEASRRLLVGRGWPVEGVRQSLGVLVEERDAEAVLQGGTCEIGVSQRSGAGPSHQPSSSSGDLV